MLEVMIAYAIGTGAVNWYYRLVSLLNLSTHNSFCGVIAVDTS